MSLDPEVKKFLDIMSKLPSFDPEMPASKARELELSALSSMPREEVGSVKDHRINDKGLLLREYVPSGKASGGAILFIHGGGFVLGSVEAYDPFARHFCNIARMRLFSIEYRLAPENRFPAAHDDSYAAFRWL
ncbi:Alpha/beta hydrolase fold-3 domain protein, partial [mine drainage metagenome]